MFALEILAARDEDEGLFHGLVVGACAGRLQGVNEKLRVRQVGPLVLAVAGAAVVQVRRVLPLGLGPLILFEKRFGVFDEFVVAPVAVGRGEADQRQRRFVVADHAFRQRDCAVALHEAFEIFQSLGHHRIVRRAAVAEDRSSDEGRHAWSGLRREGPSGDCLPCRNSMARSTALA